MVVDVGAGAGAGAGAVVSGLWTGPVVCVVHLVGLLLRFLSFYGSF